MKKNAVFPRKIRWRSFFTPPARAAIFGALLFGLFCHGAGLFNKLSHQDDIANLFGFGATVTSGRWMLHVLGWLENALFGTGSASLPLFNGVVSLLCVGLSGALLVHLLRIRSTVYSALLGALMAAFPVMTALFSYMFTSHPYMVGLLMMTASLFLICRDTPWWIKIFAVLLGGAAVGVYQAFLPVLLAGLLVYDFTVPSPREETGAWLKRIGLQAACAAGVLLVYFGVNRLFLAKFQVTLTSYQGLDHMGVMSLSTFLHRVLAAFRLFLFPPRDVAADMFPGTLHWVYYLLVGAIFVLSLLKIVRVGKKSKYKSVLLALVGLLFPLASNFIHVMAEDVHGLMVFGQMMLFPLLIALLDDMESRPFPGRRAISLAASLVLGVTGMMYARFDNQCYLKETLQQQEAVSYYTGIITRIKSQPGYTPETEVCFVNDWTELDPTIYNLDEMDFIHLNLYGHSTTEYIHTAKEFFMEKWCGFHPVWYWGEDPAAWPEVQAMPEYPADGSVRIVRDVLIVKF